MDMRLERMLKAHKQVDEASKRVLEINPRHALVIRLVERMRDGGLSQDIEEAARLLFDQARIIEGEPLDDPAAFSRRMADFMSRAI